MQARKQAEAATARAEAQARGFRADLGVARLERQLLKEERRGAHAEVRRGALLHPHAPSSALENPVLNLFNALTAGGGGARPRAGTARRGGTRRGATEPGAGAGFVVIATGG